VYIVIIWNSVAHNHRMLYIWHHVTGDQSRKHPMLLKMSWCIKIMRKSWMS